MLPLSFHASILFNELGVLLGSRHEGSPGGGVHHALTSLTLNGEVGLFPVGFVSESSILLVHVLDLEQFLVGDFSENGGVV